MNIKDTSDGLVIEIAVKPRSKNSKIVITDDKMVFLSKKPPVNGEVNKELMKVFSNFFGVETRIISGSKSNKKTLLLKQIDKIAFKEIIKANQYSRDLLF